VWLAIKWGKADIKAKKPPDRPGRLFSGGAVANLNGMASLCMSLVKCNYPVVSMHQ
jgi:hypothetical protein